MQETNSYLNSSTGGTYIEITGNAGYGTVIGNYTVNVTTNEKGINPILYFKYIKSKFGMLEKMRMDKRLGKLQKAFYSAVEAGQEALGQKLLSELSREMRESAMYAKGIRHFIEREDIIKYKNKIRGGHISDTMFKEFTRIIPKNILDKKEKFKDCFDDYVIFHYWNSEAEKNREKKQNMSPDEKAKLKDPVLFGIIKETNRLYFIADWEDEFCDLTFDEMVDVLGKDDSELTLSATPKLNY